MQNTKICFKCGKEKPLDLFYAHPKMRDGHLNKCKECTKRDVKIRSIVKSDYIKEYEKMRNQTSKRKQKIALYAKRDKEKNPDRARARNAVNNAIRNGKLKKSYTCEICGAIGPTHAHHYDYSRPLDVIWLCPKCHAQIQ